MEKPRKIAILGGGMGGLAAAWQLSRQPGAGSRFEITVYQRGWRLGGKGASGVAIAHDDQRVEEHGLHILMGFYTQIFELLEDCYGEARRGPAGASLPDWRDALTPQNTIWVSEPRGNDWEFWKTSLPEFKPLDAGVKALHNAFDPIGDWIHRLRVEVAHLTGNEEPDDSPVRPLRLGAASLTAMTHSEQLGVAGSLADAFRLSWGHAAAPVVKDHHRLRQIVSLLWFATALVTGLIRDGIVLPPHDFSSIDHWDFKEWLRRNGSSLVPAHLAWDSPYVRALYDLVFCLDTTVAAGVACNHVVHILFGWKDALYFKMNGGMGDVVFAPLYLALAKRGVKFRFFHRAKQLHVDPATNTISAITMEPQVAGVGDYDPLVLRVGTGQPRWPNEPVPDRMPERYRIDRNAQGKPPQDFETEFPSPYADPDLILERGRDFDALVLAISVGGLRAGLCDELRAHQPFDDMVKNLETMPTQAFQLWLKRDPEALGWTTGRALAGYAPGFTACTDMNQVLAHEDWNAPAPQTLGYFCGVFPDPIVDKQLALKAVARNAADWLDNEVFRLLPGAVKGGKFDRGELVDPLRGIYMRANVDPSDQYVMCKSGSTKYRLAPGDSGFGNLFLAGDWVKNPLNSGCVESAARGGCLAGDAIAERYANRAAAYVETDGDWVIRPPGALEGVRMNVFLVRADRDVLRTLCAQMFADPSAGVVEVDPLFPGFVLFVCADIRRGYSIDAPQTGDQPEKDVAFFVPVTLHVDGVRKSLAAIVPYIYVDNASGMITGREVYGFPKHLARFDFAADRSRFEASSQVRPTSLPHVPVVEDLVARLTTEHSAFEDVEGDRDAMLSAILASVGKVVEAVFVDLQLGQVPLVFLKQLRDAVNPVSACYQAIVQADAEITAIRSVRIHTGKFDLDLPPWAKPAIAATLGLGAAPHVFPVSFELDLDFHLPRGAILWKAS